MTARLAVLYDIHGNLPALEAVLDDVRRAGVERLLVGGDVVPGPMPLETFARLLAFDGSVTFIRGNGDREVLAEMTGAGVSPGLPAAVQDVIRWNARMLAAEHAEAIAAWSTTARLGVDGLGEVLFCHATPGSDTRIFTRRTPGERVLPLFAGAGASLVVCGHTHMPFDRQVGSLRIVNAGSVGMPFGAAGADWLLLGPGVEPRRTLYDGPAAAARVRSTSYPQAEAFAAVNILAPPSEAEMLDRFDQA